VPDLVLEKVDSSVPRKQKITLEDVEEIGSSERRDNVVSLRESKGVGMGKKDMSGSLLPLG